MAEKRNKILKMLEKAYIQFMKKMKIVLAIVALNFAPNQRQMQSGCGARNATNGRTKTAPKEMFHFMFVFVVLQTIMTIFV